MHSQISTKRKLHGYSKTPEYRIWKGALTRCYNPNATGFKYWGGRGIIVSDRWNPRMGGGFVNFLRDMGRRPSPKHSIDRRDNDGHYSPDNCRWVTRKEQNLNSRARISITRRLYASTRDRDGNGRFL